jgi:glutathione-independent formaldehyde dehydrogenase
LLGASAVVVGDMNADRLTQARSFDCETVNLTQDAELPDMIEQILGQPEVDAAIDAVGFEARGHGENAGEAPATVLNDIMTIARAGASLGIPGL